MLGALAGVPVPGVGSEDLVLPGHVTPPSTPTALLDGAVAGSASADRVAVAALLRASILAQVGRENDAVATLKWIVDHDSDIVSERCVSCFLLYVYDEL